MEGSMGMMILMVVVPLIMSQLKKLYGQHTWLIPVTAPVLGVLTDVASNLAATYAPVVGLQQGWKAAAFGLAGVGLREIVDQLRAQFKGMGQGGAWRLFAFVVVSMLAITACSPATSTTAPDQSLQEAAKSLAQFAHEDLQQAIVIAGQTDDQTAITCYQTLDKYVGAGRVLDIPEIKGLVSAFQTGRNLLRRVRGTNPVLEDINRGCAALFTDAKFTLIRLGLIGAK